MPLRNQFIATGARCAFLLATAVCSPVDAGEEQMTKYGCYSCHRVGEKLIGPAFREVAKRYRERKDADEYLFTKIREGGEGVWGDIPMVPHPEEKISSEELRTLIAWIRQL